jgi:phage-related protein
MGLDKEDRLEIGSDIANIEVNWPIGTPVCRPLGKGLYEVRSNISSQRISRVIFLIEQNRMVLLHGFIKKSHKIPEKEMEIAVKRQKEVRSI